MGKTPKSLKDKSKWRRCLNGTRKKSRGRGRERSLIELTERANQFQGGAETKASMNSQSSSCLGENPRTSKFSFHGKEEQG